MFSAVAITSFLASVGSLVGGGMAAGVGVIATTSAVVGGVIGSVLSK